MPPRHLCCNNVRLITFDSFGLKLTARRPPGAFTHREHLPKSHIILPETQFWSHHITQNPGTCCMKLFDQKMVRLSMTFGSSSTRKPCSYPNRLTCRHLQGCSWRPLMPRFEWIFLSTRREHFCRLASYSASAACWTKHLCTARPPFTFSRAVPTLLLRVHGLHRSTGSTDMFSSSWRLAWREICKGSSQ